MTLSSEHLTPGKQQGGILQCCQLIPLQSQLTSQPPNRHRQEPTPETKVAPVLGQNAKVQSKFPTHKFRVDTLGTAH